MEIERCERGNIAQQWVRRETRDTDTKTAPWSKSVYDGRVLYDCISLHMRRRLPVETGFARGLVPGAHCTIHKTRGRSCGYQAKEAENKKNNNPHQHHIARHVRVMQV